MGNRLARLDFEQHVVERREGRIATGLRDASQKSRSPSFLPTDDDYITAIALGEWSSRGPALPFPLRGVPTQGKAIQ